MSIARGQFSPPWNDPDWQAQAKGWIHSQASSLGHVITGDIEQVHNQPWSTLRRAPTTAGALYFKAVMPTLSHEPRLTAMLADRFPDTILPVLAIDDERGWMLQPDGGQTLRASGSPRERLAVWPAALTALADIQQALLGESDALLALGVADRRLTSLPAQFAELLDDEEALRLGEPDGITIAVHDRLRATQQRFAANCQHLGSLGIPESLHLDDFHDANMLVGHGTHEDGAGQPSGLRIIDWGDTALAHPFFSLLVSLRSIGYRLEDETGLEPVGEFPEVSALRNVYLRCWTDYLSPDDLYEASRIAAPLSMVSRAISWRDDLYSLAPPARLGNTHTVPAWLRIYLDSEMTGARPPSQSPLEP